MIQISYQKLHPNAIVPKKAYPDDTGYDIYPAVSRIIEPGETKAIETGLIIQAKGIPAPFKLDINVRSRSGLALKGIVVANSPGTVDGGYTGELKVIAHNNGDKIFYVEPHKAIGQLVFNLCTDVVFVEGEIEETSRKVQGFGSTDNQIFFK